MRPTTILASLLTALALGGGRPSMPTILAARASPRRATADATTRAAT